jgi:hypothetical protein
LPVLPSIELKKGGITCVGSHINNKNCYDVTSSVQYLAVEFLETCEISTVYMNIIGNINMMNNMG